MEYVISECNLLSVPDAAVRLRQGEKLLLTREAEPGGMLCQAAQFANSETITFFQRLAGRRISVVLASERYDVLRFPLREGRDVEPISCALDTGEIFTGETVTALTLRALVDPLTSAGDLVSPGPVSVLRAQPGNILARKDYPEGALELLGIAGLELGAVLSMSLTAASKEQAVQEGIAQISLEEIVSYRRRHQVSFVTETLLPTEFATFRLRHYQDLASRQPYLVLVLGDLNQEEPAPLLRLHSACMTGDVFGSRRCDCQAQLHAAMAAIADEGRGVLLYLPQEGRGIGIAGKLQAYLLQEQGYDTLEANTRLGYPIDAREYGCAIEILQELGLKRVRLLTNNPEKLEALQEYGLSVERVPLEIAANESNHFYLQTKYQRMGHLFNRLQNT